MKNKLKPEINRPPVYLTVLFAGFALAAFFNIAQNISAELGIKPFGLLQQVIAQVAGRPGPNTGQLVESMYSGEIKLQDTLDRCEIIDPNLAGGMAFAAQLGNAGVGSREFSAAGVNIAPVLDTAFSTSGSVISMGDMMKAAFETAEEIDGGYVLGMVTNAEGVSYDQVVNNTAEFIREANQRDLRPIVRLCYPGRCGFPLASNPESVSNFYIDVNTQVKKIAGDAEYIAMIGPNEPGTAGEMESFGFAAPGIGGYELLVSTLNNVVAPKLQEYRVKNGGNMYLAPGAMNLTNRQNNDVAAYFGVAGPGQQGSLKIDPGLFDYMLGNTYNLPGSLAYGWYDGSNIPDEDPSKALLTVKDRMESDYADLKFILTEFGIFVDSANPKKATPEDVSRIKEQFEQFCADDTIEGILFFRSFQNFVIDGTVTDEATARGFQPTPAQDWLSLDELKDITANCSFQKKIISPRDFAWTNCNIDSCLYQKSYDDRSIAKACGTELDADESTYSDPEKGAALKVDCSGGPCVTRMMTTLEVAMPIKQFGNNTSAGTASQPYTPICAEIANTLGQSDYDALNQFAGELTDKSGNTYAMPWLGSAINCASELIKSAYDYPVTQELDFSFEPHLGSSSTETYAELSDELNKPSTKYGDSQFNGFPLSAGGQTTVVQDQILDERAVCPGYSEDGREVCLDKALASDELRSFRAYNPFSKSASKKFVLTDACSTELTYKNDVGNYVIGPEIKLTEPTQIASYGRNEICLDYAKRNTEQKNPQFYTNGLVQCIIHEEELVQSSTGPALCPADFLCTNGEPFIGDPEDPNYHKGLCGGIPSMYDGCLEFTGEVLKPSPTSTLRSDELGVYYKTNSYPEIPEYEIPGMYDALYRMYLRLQSQLSTKGQKIVFRENMGIQSKVSVKIRDANRPTEAFDTGSPTGDSGLHRPYLYGQKLPNCSVSAQMFDNEYFLAKNNPLKTEYQYYDWLGYLDIIQEQSSIIGSSSQLSDMQLEDNPLIASPEALKVPNTNQIPVTLDPKNRPYLYRSGDAQLMTTYPIPSCDDVEIQKYDTTLTEEERIGVDSKVTCLTNTNDDRFEDDLALFLCKKGYSVPNYCDALVCKPQETPPSTGENPEEELDIEKGDLLIYPVGTDLKIPQAFCGTGVDAPDLVTVDLLDRYYYPSDNIDPDKDSELRLHSGAANALTNLLKDMQQNDPSAYAQCAFNWGYRSSDTQAAQPGQCGAGTGTACACESEHQLGTAVDFRPAPNADGTGPSVNQFNDNNLCFRWLTNNAHRYGYIRSFMPNNPDGYSSETWHWRWIGTELANEFNSTKDQYGGHLKTFLEAKFEESQKDKGTSSQIPSGGVTCPVVGGYCIQGPAGDFSHGTLNAVDLKGSNRDIVAPFPGKIVEYRPGVPFRQNYCRDNTYDAGDGFAFEGIVGGKTYRMLFYHVDVRGANLQIGDTFTTGQKITRMATFGDVTLDGNTVNSLSCQEIDSADNQHLHFEFYEGNAQNPIPYDMASFSAALGCNMELGDASCTPKEDLDLGSPTEPEVPYVCTIQGDTDITQPGDRTVYASFDELVKAVATYIASSYGDAYPFELLYATAWNETRLVSARDEGLVPFNGDPFFQSHVNPTETAAELDVRGPMQFELGTWNGIIQNNSQIFYGCLENLGITDYNVDPMSRTYLGPALCAAAIKHNENLKYWIGEKDFSELDSKEDWFNQIYPRDTARANWANIFYLSCIERGDNATTCEGARAEGERYDRVDYNLSPIHIIARRYYGACLFEFASVKGDYCQCMYSKSSDFNTNTCYETK